MSRSDHSIGPNEEAAANEAVVGQKCDLIWTLTVQRIPSSYDSAVIYILIANIIGRIISIYWMWIHF